MDLDDFKAQWEAYDKKLNKQLELNEKLLRNMNLDRSKTELQKLLNYEGINAILYLFLIIYTTYAIVSNWGEPLFYLPAILSTIIVFISMILAVKKYNQGSQIDYYNSPILTVQKEFTAFKATILRFRKIEFILIPFLVLFLIPILAKSIHGTNIYDFITDFTIRYFVILICIAPLVLWTNRHLYDKKLKHSEQFLNDIQHFEQEA